MQESPSIRAIDAVVNVWDHRALSKRPAHMATFFKHMGMDRRYTETGVPLAVQVDEMKSANIDKGFLIATSLGEWDMPYEWIYEAVAEYPDFFYGMAGINPTTGMDGVRKLQDAVVNHGFIGAHVYPHWFRTPPNDKIYYPFYAKCCELGIPIQIQIGHSAQTFVPTVAHPILLDEIAIYFPELKIIGIHTGWPWIEEAIAVAWKHPNVYLGSDAHSPKYWKPEFTHYLKTRGKDKVIWGTDWPILQFQRTLDEVEDLHLSADVKRRFLRDNVIRVYNLKDKEGKPIV